MFTEAIERVAQFTRPIHTISRLYNATEVIPGASTLFLVNDEGWALTCKHVVQQLAASEQVNKTYASFKAELQKLQGDPDYETKKAQLERQFNYNNTATVEMKNMFIGCADQLSGFQFHVHPHYDLALVKLQGFQQLYCSELPVFQQDESYLKQGRYLCRLGHPFPEFSNYRYNASTDSIEWTNEGYSHSPTFPIEGMITRFLGDQNGPFGIEMSTPGLKGQSGGPLFNDKGVVQGMQFATKHLHLGFDIEGKEILVNGQHKQINDYSFIHLGHCIHVSVIKAFMREKGVVFKEG